MKKRNFNGKGQFSIIAALLVAVVLVTVLMTTYSLVRNSPFETSPQTLDAVNEINLALKNLLTYTIGYYCSILQVAGNRTYAQGLTSNYLSGGLASIANEYAQWNPSFTYSSSNTYVTWFNPTSYSLGNLSVTYSLSGLGINNINYSTSSELNAVFNSASATQTRITVTEEGGQPVLGLTPQAFNFYSYNNVSSAWTTVHPSSASAFGNGTYVVSIPSGVDYNAYVVQITDPRSITVTVSRLSYYTYALTWNSTLYSSSLKNDVIVVEVLQNGSLRWLGQNLKLTTKGRPIPPIPVKAFQVNETINNVTRQVPFQVEDWASQYTVPLGISSNASIFSSQNMLVFEINHNVTSVRISWNGKDSANQTSYAITDRYFKQDNTQNGTLGNGILKLVINNFVITSTIGTSSVTANFMRVNDYGPTYGSGVAYVITKGIVRDIVQQEAEWGTSTTNPNGGIPNCPNLYSQIVITLPANATYYTYALRTIFVNSSQSRTVSDLSLIQLSISLNGGKTLTENGTKSNGYPNTWNITSTGTTLFRNFTATGGSWVHHWSEYLQSNNNGGGIMFTNASNFNLYAFDKKTTHKTGALNVTETSQKVVIEVDPVTNTGGSASFKYPLDLTWYGAVVNFAGTMEPIYPTSGNPALGLWVIVEAPPTVAIS